MRVWRWKIRRYDSMKMEDKEVWRWKGVWQVSCCPISSLTWRGGELAGWKNPHHLTLTQKILVQTKSFRKLGKGGRERDRERERERGRKRKGQRERERERARGCLPMHHLIPASRLLPFTIVFIFKATKMTRKKWNYPSFFSCPRGSLPIYRKRKYGILQLMISAGEYM